MSLRHAMVLVLVCTWLSACATPRSDEVEIREFVARFVRSVNEADVESFVSCFEPDATAFFPSSANAPRRVGREAIRTSVTPTFHQGPPATRVTPRDLSIDVDRDLAYVTFDGGSGAMHLRRTLVLRKTRDAWAIAHLHASNVSE